MVPIPDIAFAVLELNVIFVFTEAHSTEPGSAYFAARRPVHNIVPSIYLSQPLVA